MGKDPPSQHLAVYRIQSSPRELWFVFPWCQHGNLTRYIGVNPEIATSDRLKLLCDAARGLRYLHSLVPPIAHGAVNSSNVLVMDNMEAALCDWRHSTVFAALWSDDSMNTRVSSNDRWEGVAGFLAKELLLDCGPPVTAAGDVYAFG